MEFFDDRIKKSLSSLDLSLKDFFPFHLHPVEKLIPDTIEDGKHDRPKLFKKAIVKEYKFIFDFTNELKIIDQSVWSSTSLCKQDVLIYRFNEVCPIIIFY